MAEWWRGRRAAGLPTPSTTFGGSPPPPGEDQDPFRAVPYASARRRLGGVPARAARHRKAAAVGAGAHGDPRERARPSARARYAKPYSCRGARRARRAVGDGGGGKMRLPLRRDRRNLGRPSGARLHRDAAARGGVRAQRHALLAGPARRDGEPQRRTDALADREHAVAHERARSESAGAASLGRRAVPSARVPARPVERRA